MNTQIQKTMQANVYVDDEEETLSLSNFLIQDDDAMDNSQDHNTSMSISSSSSSEQDFLGFFTEDQWGKNSTTSYPDEDIVFCGKVVSASESAETKSQTKPLFRSNSDSFRFIRLKTGSTRKIASRSKSMPSRSGSGSGSFPCKSRFMVFMFGSGSSKFPTRVDMSEIKSRQLRQQNASLGSGESDGGTNGKVKGWWRVVDVLGCSGGYGRETMV